MRYHSILLFFALLALAGVGIISCSQGKDSAEEQSYPRIAAGNPTRDSVHFYTMGEVAFSQGDLITAYGLFNQADLHDPENISIKERIIETLWIISREEEERNEEIIRRVENYIARDLYTADMLRYYGLACFETERTEKGLQAFEMALEIDNDPYAYYEFFFYNMRMTGEFEFSYLDKALNLGSDDPELVYTIAEIYEYNNPQKSREIYEAAAERFADEESQDRLVSFYLRFNEWPALTTYLREELSASRPVTKESMRIYLEILFYQEEYSTILKHIEHVETYQNIEIYEIFFFAAYYAEAYEQAISLADRILHLPDYPEEKRETMFASIGELYALDGDYDTAADYLLLVDDLHLIASAVLTDYISEMPLTDDNEGEFTLQKEEIKNRVDVDLLIDTLSRKGLSQIGIDYITAALYMLTDREDEGLQLFESLTGKIEDDELNKKIGIQFLSHDKPEKALRVLSSVKDPDFEPYSFLGSYYYVARKDSLAMEYFWQALNVSDHPSNELFLSLADLLNRNSMHNKELQVMEQAVEFHPEDPLILNWLGYTLVMHTTRYEEAEEHLLKAISLEPENYHIQDSIAWLYYNLEEYHKALDYMQDIISWGPDDSIVAYHIGMIYYKLDDRENAREYLQQAIELNTDNDYRERAEIKLRELELAYE